MRGLTGIKGRAGVNLSCGDKEEEVLLSEVRLIEFVPTIFHHLCTEMASFITFGTLNLSDQRSAANSENDSSSSAISGLPIVCSRCDWDLKPNTNVQNQDPSFDFLAQANSTAHWHTRITATQHLVQRQSTGHTRDSRQCISLYIHTRLKTFTVMQQSTLKVDC